MNLHDAPQVQQPVAQTADRASQGVGWRRLGSEDMTALVLFALTALLILSSGWISPSLGSWTQARAILVLSTFVMVIGFGQQTVILTGGLDLSVPAVVTVGAVMLFSVVGPEPAALLWGIPLVLLVTGAIGIVNGVFVALLRVPPFLMTLAMGLIVASAMLGITGGAPQGVASKPIVALFAGDWLGVPLIVHAMVLLTVVAMLVQRRTAFGRMLYAIGTSPDAAYIAGLQVNHVTIVCYAISGVASGLAGILMVGFSQGATLNSGDDLLFPTITAVLVGGTSILGGRGSYLGVVGGALLLTTFSTMISALGIGAGWRSILFGTVILLALLTLQEDLRTWVARQRAPRRTLNASSTTAEGISRGKGSEALSR